jgi:hypothetical protein
MVIDGSLQETGVEDNAWLEHVFCVLRHASENTYDGM